ncbi:MAG TPA: MFS transporter [Ktedonobacteraceae bacterium]|jgi:MFS family permease|nr:MFS transporter [Ktedonobacteraceae bacterium]
METDQGDGVKNTNRDTPSSVDVASLPLQDAAILAAPSHDPYQALRFRSYRFLLIGTFIAAIGEQMVNIAIGWELYDRTGSALVLGGVGLAQVLPVIVLSLIAGHVADHRNRKVIVIITATVLACCSLGLALLSYLHGSLVLIYACLTLIGVAMAFNTPAADTLPTYAVPDEAYENAATWSSSSWQLAAVLGPALGGGVIAVFGSATWVYIINAVAALLFAILLIPLRVRPVQKALPEGKPKKTTTMKSLGEGIGFLRHTQVLLAAITLDLFAVLFGGATTLLPIFARDILKVGPEGLGWLRAAPSVGAVLVAVYLAHQPPFKHAGRTLLFAVCGFGIATIVFGLSRSFWLSLVMLFLLGGLDNFSVVIRSTLTLTRTPDAMRGRVAAINGLFVSASNELGGFESGLTAQLLGPTLSVVGGGIGTIIVVVCVALIWPALRRLGALRET